MDNAKCEITQNDSDKALKLLQKKANMPSITCGEWVLAPVIEAMFGLTSETLRSYKRTIWPEGIYWKKNPAGRLVYNTKQINKWMGSDG